MAGEGSAAGLYRLRKGTLKFSEKKGVDNQLQTCYSYYTLDTNWIQACHLFF